MTHAANNRGRQTDRGRRICARLSAIRCTPGQKVVCISVTWARISTIARPLVFAMVVIPSQSRLPQQPGLWLAPPGSSRASRRPQLQVRAESRTQQLRTLLQSPGILKVSIRSGDPIWTRHGRLCLRFGCCPAGTLLFRCAQCSAD